MLWTQAPDGDLRAAVEAQFLPAAEVAEFEDSHFMTFLEQLDLQGTVEPHFQRLPADARSSYREYEERIGALLRSRVPEPTRSRRLLHASSLCLRMCAVRERGRHRAAEQIPLAVHVNELFDLLIGVLTAEVSEQTRSALSKAP